MRTAEGPTAAERDITAQPQFSRFAGGKTQGCDKGVRQVREVMKVVLRIVEGQRIDRLNFNAADAGLLHGAEFAVNFGLSDAPAKPPPADHDSLVPWRIHKVPVQLVEIGGLPSCNDKRLQEPSACREQNPYP